jgi:hypothetical protein
MTAPTKLALTSLALNLLTLLVYTLAVSGGTFQNFTLATEILSVMGVVNLTLSIVALTRSFQQAENQRARILAWLSLAIALSMLFVIGILS